MNDDYPKYDLLARYLDPQFGNIYEYNMKPGQVAGFDFQDWTDDLRQAVRQYLLQVLPEDLWDYLAEPDDDESEDSVTKEAQVDRLIEVLQPADVALIVRQAAVVAVPTLQQLIGHLGDWPSEDERLDTETWLESHGDAVDWRRLAAATDHHELTAIRMPSGRVRQPYPDDLVQTLTPAELLAAWEFEIGPSPTDLSESEWQLLETHFGPRSDSRLGTRIRSANELDAKRRVFNAIRFKAAHPMPWSQLPSRYGPSTSIYQTYHHYRADGLFIRLRDVLKDEPAAESLVAWLDGIIAEPAPKEAHP